MPENCAEQCPLVPRVEALEEESRENKKAHKGIYEKLEASHTSVAVIEERLGKIKEDTEEIKATVQVMKDKPGKRWDGIVDKALWLVIGAVITFLLAKAGL